MSRISLILSAFLLSSAAFAQPFNPGTPTSGSPANDECAKFVVSGGFVNSITGTGSPCVAGSASALTRTNDSNVTITLGGSPTVALLAATSLTVGWNGVLPFSRFVRGTNGQLLIAQTGADSLYATVTGDWTITAAGVATLATVNTNVGSFGSATQCVAFTVNGKGLITAASAVTCTPAASSITGGAALTKTDDTNVTLTLGGTPTSSLLAATSLTLGWTSQLSIARGGTGQATQQAAFDTLAPTATRAGDITYWNGTHYVNLAGNNSGTNVLTENPSGVPSWAAPGTGTVTSVVCGTGLSGGTITTTGTCAVNLSTLTNSLSGNVALNNTANYFTGPTVAQGTVGTWCASGTVTLFDTVIANFVVKLWDGTTVISSAVTSNYVAVKDTAVSLSGCITNPAGNIRISAKDTTAVTGSIDFNDSGESKDSTLTVWRVQ